MYLQSNDGKHMTNRLIHALLVSCVLGGGCGGTSTDGEDAGGGEGDDTDSETGLPDCPSPYDCVYEWECEPAGGIALPEYFCGGTYVCCNVDADTDTDDCVPEEYQQCGQCVF